MASRSQGDVWIEGKVKFAQTHSPSKFDKYTVTLYPNDKGMVTFNELKAKGIKNDLKKDDDGYYTSFHRATFLERMDGRKVPLEPPKVLNKEGVFITDIIGPGSDVSVMLETYGGAGTKGKYYAARLAAVRVDNLVPYMGNKMLPLEARAMKGVSEQPEQLF